VVPSLKKPVGVLATATQLVIADQDARQIVTFPLPVPPARSHAEPKVLASIPSADLLAAGPDGSFFTGRRDGVVRQIDAGGEVHEIVSGFHQVRGIAFDPKKHRLFFVDHEGAAGGGGGSSTLIIRTL
jgi:glucose/arabinose dehydrogenase